MKKAVVISAGSINDYEYINSYINREDFVICADGGLHHAEKLGIVPNLTVGDFDSYNKEVKGEVMRFNPEKDYTDTHIAVREALERGYKKIVLLGCIGTRLDHTLSNIGLLQYIKECGGEGLMADEHNEIFVAEKRTVVKKKEGWHLSIIPIGEAYGVTLKKLKYTLDDYDLKFSESLAVSNEFIEEDAEICVDKGTLIVMLTKD